MRIEAHNKLGQPIVADITRVVVYDDYDNPISVAVKQDEGWIYVGHCRDPEFNDFLSGMGIDITYIVEELDIKKIKPIKDDNKRF